MKKNILSWMLLIAASITFYSANASYRDSIIQPRFGVLFSLKPILIGLSGSDSMQNSLYSHNTVEFQYNHNKHRVSLGLDANRKMTLDNVNGAHREILNKRIAFSPSYSYNLYNKSRFNVYGGLGYIYNSKATVSELQSGIEKITQTTSSIEEGMNVFLRLNYRLNKRFSVEFEMAYYHTRERWNQKTEYSLINALNTNEDRYYRNDTYALPANVWLKYSF